MGKTYRASDMVVWADEVMLVVNKPAGLTTLPDGYDPDAPHLVQVLQDEYGAVMIVHRLDKDTSGVVVLARNPQAHRILNDQFALRQTSKVYHALVVGRPDWQVKNVHLALRPNGDRKHRTVIDPRQGKPAQTELHLLETYRQYSLIEARPRTGRTHQIRVHLAALGLPVVADGLYGDGRALFLSEFKTNYRSRGDDELPLLARLGLHAFSLTLHHPVSLQPMIFEAPYPKDLDLAIRSLRRYSLSSSA